MCDSDWENQWLKKYWFLTRCEKGGGVNGKAGVVQLILLATYYGLNGGMIADGEMMVIGGKMMVDRKWASTDQEVLPGAGQGSHHLSLPPPPISKRESWEVSCILPSFLFWCTHVQPRAPIISHSNLPFQESVWEVEPKWMFWKPSKKHFGGSLLLAKYVEKNSTVFFSQIYKKKERKNLQKTMKS